MSTAPSASSINYQMSSREDHWVYFPVCYFKPTDAVIKVNREKREVSIRPRRKPKGAEVAQVNARSASRAALPTGGRSS
jgi:hypothetical protein